MNGWFCTDCEDKFTNSRPDGRCQMCGGARIVPVHRVEDKWGGYWQCAAKDGPYNFRTPPRS